ncbi:hypothetical protein P154DRAFT_539121 [Amniculicola lignicola CBS 123094]|uniref:AA1-like domain-containing protein n=1 Tax=Amniculicola lignicola CBS 123094 TaxID=1392246 RepID=A0A6A5W278_9PLEO|nr:hypothetical protein P154DRAFT_539121 [Amniculicola lignicola CBS 123094]
MHLKSSLAYPLLFTFLLPLVPQSLATPHPPLPLRQTSAPRTGHIKIYHPTWGQLGCLDIEFRAVDVSHTPECAVFTYSIVDDVGYLSTEAGNCGFHDPLERDNPDSTEEGNRAWRCKQGLQRKVLDDGVTLTVLFPWPEFRSVFGSSYTPRLLGSRLMLKSRRQITTTELGAETTA